MTPLEGIALGLIQGLTEFFPVSSSGHLALWHWITATKKLSLPTMAMLHAGTLGAVLWVYRSKLWQLLQHFFRGKSSTARADRTLCWKLLTATLATAPGALLARFLWNGSETELSLMLGFMVTAGLIFSVAFFRGKSTQESLSWGQAIALGFAQGFAILPGISRAGIVVVTAYWLGLKPKFALEVAFLLAIPVILAAVLQGLWEGVSWSLELGVGMAVAFGAGIWSIRLMQRWINGSWHYFGWYCLLFAVGLGTYWVLIK